MQDSDEKEPWAISTEESENGKKPAAFDRIASDLKSRLVSLVSELNKMKTADLLSQRYEKFRAMGRYSESAERSEQQAG